MFPARIRLIAPIAGSPAFYTACPESSSTLRPWGRRMFTTQNRAVTIAMSNLRWLPHCSVPIRRYVRVKVDLFRRFALVAR